MLLHLLFGAWMRNINMDYLPAIISLAGVVATVFVNLWLGLAKQRTENRTVKVSAETELRDDLLAIIERHEAQIAARDKKIEEREQRIGSLQETISTQLTTITELRIAVRNLEYEVKELRAELDKFNRKVYYIPKEDDKN